MKFTSAQFNILRNMNLCEDFDKVVGAIRNLKGQIDSYLQKWPADKMHTIVTILMNNQEEWDTMNPEEYDLFSDLLAQSYGLSSRKLQMKLKKRHAEIENERAAAKEQAQQYSPEDWLKSYAKHQGMPTSQPEAPPEKKLAPNECHSCGTFFDPDSSYCSEDGHKLGPVGPEECDQCEVKSGRWDRW